MLLLVTLFVGRSPVEARGQVAQVATSPIGVYYVGPEDLIAQSIDLASPYLVRVDQPDLAQVIVINNAPLKDSLEVFSNEIQQGRVGLVLFCGPLFPQSVEDLRALLGVSTFGLDRVSNPAPVRASPVDDVLQHTITWGSAPEIHARTLITNPNLLQPVVITTSGQGVIQRVRSREQTQALIVDAWLSDASNAAWETWPYFNYLIYDAIADAANAARILTYANYPPSPTPDRTGRWIMAGVGMGIMVGVGAIYYAARRRLYLNPALAAKWREAMRGAASRDSALDGSQPPEAGAWQRAGFHRPLAGFLTYLPLALLLFLPLIAYDVYILPDLLMPDAQGLQTWEAVTNWTMVVWILLDAGTGTAAVRLFSAHHIHSPQRASRYLQFFIWWQLISGALQLGVTCILCAAVIPALGLAHLTYFILARAALQLPGFLGVFGVAFRARQRFDFQQFLNLTTMISVPLLQIMLILLVRPWGEITPEIGPGLGGALGLAGGILLANVFTFVLGALLNRRDGQRLRALFLPTFDAQTSEDVLTFGIPWAIGAAIPALGVLLQANVLISQLTPPGLQVESWRLLLLLAGGFEILLTGLYLDLMPMLSEARAMSYRTLLRYATSQGIRYGAWFSFFLFAVLGAIGERAFATILSSRYGDAAPWLMAMLLWGALRWATWLPDRMLEAAGRPWLIVLLAFIEQAVRIGGSLVLVRLWGAPGLMAAYGAGLLLRAVLARHLAGRALVRARIYIWQALIAPAGSAILTYQILRIVLIYLWPATASSATWGGGALLAIGLLLPSLWIYGFLTALLGGWDDGILSELQEATAISSIGFPAAWVLVQCVRLGAHISPLHGRYPIALYSMAQEEAHALTLAQSQAEAIIGTERSV